MVIATENNKRTEVNENGKLDLEASDVTGQHMVRMRDFPRDSTVGDLVRQLVGRMELRDKDANGATYTYHARLEREGRHLHASEVVGDALKSGDRISLQPNIDAG